MMRNINNLRQAQPFSCFIPILAVLWIILSPCLSQAARLLSSDTLINQSRRYDRQTVQFRGEVVGDIMHRGTHCWINVNDGPQALGIYCPERLVKSIRFIGDYKYNGDTIEVTGTFHKACPQHGGELDIHAEELKIIKTGDRRPHLVTQSKIRMAIALFACTLLVLGLHIYRKKFQRRTIS
ncbi:MAG: hypothetical protein AB1611_02230 [bacterium]